MSKKLDKYEFIWKAIQKHGYKYDYRKVNYIDAKTKVCITCPEHGDFWQLPSMHMQGRGCPICAGKYITNNYFIIKAKKKHGNKYDYSKVEYINNHTKICIVCQKHGEFWQTPEQHLKGCGCVKCGRIQQWDKRERISLKEFINRANKVHGEKYDYSKINYVNTKTKVCIICPKHGEFWQTPGLHLKGCGCPSCIGRNKTSEGFVEKLKKIHGDKYDYSKVEYKNNKTKICIICEKHGEFLISPVNMLHGAGCHFCYKESLLLSKTEFIEKAKEAHGNRYDYSKVDYINTKTKVCIVCPKHGEFWQAPNSHLRGQGCFVCKESKLEKKVRMFLEKNGIKHECQKRFEWLGLQSLDFYLPDYNIAIECQGIQHFEPKSFGSKKENAGIIAYEDCVKRDKKKLLLCTENGINIIYINYFDNENEIKEKLTFCQ